MTADEKRQLIEILETSRTEFLSSLTGHNPETLSQRPTPERWSMLECAEHVAVVEQAMLTRLESAPRSAEALRHLELELRIRAGATDRSTPRQAPVRVQPTGRFPSLAEAITQFNNSRDRTVEFVDSTEDLILLSGAHPVFGPMNGYEMVLFMCTHSSRHANQIREIRSQI
jgi:hypothetical protein